MNLEAVLHYFTEFFDSVCNHVASRVHIFIREKTGDTTYVSNLSSSYKQQTNAWLINLKGSLINLINFVLVQAEWWFTFNINCSLLIF